MCENCECNGGRGGMRGSGGMRSFGGMRGFLTKEESFLTKEEKVEMLKEYKDNLEKETQGVKERIKELEKEKNS